jgi:hypothetical protein
MTLDQPSPLESDRLQQPTTLPLSNLPAQSPTWLWPQRIPLGKLTLLDGAPGCGTTLFALMLAACVTAGLPLPDGTSCIQGPVLLITPHDNLNDTLLPRLQAAGAKLDQIMTLNHVLDATPGASPSSHPFSLSHDLTLLESIITGMGVVLLILDPFSAIPGWRRALPALIQLAARTHCAIVLTRSLSRAPADPLHPHCPASPVLTAARSHLLLAPDPADERHCLLLTPKHPLCAPLTILSYAITTEEGIPIIQWLPAPDPSELRRLCTGPIRSLQRQAILRFLYEQPTPRTINDILRATSYDYEAGRKMLLRMQQAGELVSPARGLYTTADHPCLAHFTNDSQSPSPTSPVPVPTVPNVAGESSTSVEQSDSENLRARMTRPQDYREVRALIEARLSAARCHTPTIPVSNVPCPNSNLSHDSPATDIPTTSPLANTAITLPSQPTIPTSEKNARPASDIAVESSMSIERSDGKDVGAQSFVPWGMEGLSPGAFGINKSG